MTLWHNYQWPIVYSSHGHPMYSGIIFSSIYVCPSLCPSTHVFKVPFTWELINGLEKTAWDAGPEGGPEVIERTMTSESWEIVPTSSPLSKFFRGNTQLWRALNQKSFVAGQSHLCKISSLPAPCLPFILDLAECSGNVPADPWFCSSCRTWLSRMWRMSCWTMRRMKSLRHWPMQPLSLPKRMSRALTSPFTVLASGTSC